MTGMIVETEDSDYLKGRLSNGKFKQATQGHSLLGQSRETIDVVEALAATYGDAGWLEGHTSTLVGFIVEQLVGQEEA